MNSTQKTILAAAVVATVFIASWLLLASPVSDEKHSQMGLASIEEASENSRIIAELHKSLEILDKRVNEALELAKYRLRTLRFVPVVVTAYNPAAAQTDSTPQITASNNSVRPGIVVLSRDLEAEFGFKFGDPVLIKGLGCFLFEDRMSKR